MAIASPPQSCDELSDVVPARPISVGLETRMRRIVRAGSGASELRELARGYYAIREGPRASISRDAR